LFFVIADNPWIRTRLRSNTKEAFFFVSVTFERLWRD